MYDDDSSYTEVASWYGDQQPDPSQVAHLCPECRDLMDRVVRHARAATFPPPEPDWSRALRWLDGLCGGRDAVLTLDAEPLSTEGLDLPAAAPPADRQRLESCRASLAAAAAELFDDEAGTAFVRALLRVYDREPAVIAGARSAADLALGVVSVVGRANGLLRPRGGVTVKQLRALLDATASGSTTAGKVRAALQGPYRWSTTDLGWALGGGDSGDLVPLGHVDLLVSTVRRRLLEVRERALAAQAAEAPR